MRQEPENSLQLLTAVPGPTTNKVGTSVLQSQAKEFCQQFTGAWKHIFPCQASRGWYGWLVRPLEESSTELPGLLPYGNCEILYLNDFKPLHLWQFVTQQ